MKKTFKSEEEAREALENDPDFIALVEDLKGQSPDRIEKLGDLLGGLQRKDEDDGLDTQNE